MNLIVIWQNVPAGTRLNPLCMITCVNDKSTKLSKITLVGGMGHLSILMWINVYYWQNKNAFPIFLLSNFTIFEC